MFVNQLRRKVVSIGMQIFGLAVMLRLFGSKDLKYYLVMSLLAYVVAMVAFYGIMFYGAFLGSLFHEKRKRQIEEHYKNDPYPGELPPEFRPEQNAGTKTLFFVSNLRWRTPPTDNIERPSPPCVSLSFFILFKKVGA